ncbi:MAG: class I lanthipeptide [Cyclobacteriaceae bacterium]
MKKKKLTLEKLTISKLSNAEMKMIMGAYSDGFTSSSSLFGSCHKTNSGAMVPGNGHVRACHC